MRVLVSLVVVSAFFASGCGGSGSPTGPTPGGVDSTNQGALFNVEIIGGGANYTAKFNGVTYDGPQFLTVRLKPGTYIVEGVSGAGLANITVVAAASREGSIAVGSWRVLAGPLVASQSGPCGATFGNMTAASAAFKVEFRVEQGTNGTCWVA
jgi:hypothetical protein